MSTGVNSGIATDKPRVLVIDCKSLRQAGVVRLLEAWGECLGLTMVAIPPTNASLEECSVQPNCEMVILSVGSASVEDPENQAWIKSVRTLIPDTPLVILSDREEPEEVYAAFRAGAAGFMPTSIELTAALQALSFIRSGGPFFPPSVLSHACNKRAVPFARAAAATRHANGANGWSNEVNDCAERLTAKQEEVIGLLRQGETNKLIARRLGMSEATVKVHVRRIMRKLGVKNRTQVAIAQVNETQPLDHAHNGNREPAAAMPRHRIS